MSEFPSGNPVSIAPTDVFLWQIFSCFRWILIDLIIIYIWVRIQHLFVSLYFFEHLLLVCNCVILSPFLLCFIFPINKLNIAMKYSGSALCRFACLLGFTCYLYLLGFTCYLQRYTIKYWHIYITGPSNEYNHSDTETRSSLH